MLASATSICLARGDCFCGECSACVEFAVLSDEPMNGLDPMGIEELRELIRSFSAQGITVILSSHILSEVQLVADYVGIISSGILGYEGPFKQGQNLEELFMDVVRKNKKAGEICD